MTTENNLEQRGNQKLRIGIVVSNKMDKTISVAITRHTKTKPYGKYIKKTIKYLAHDKDNSCNIGDTVRIVETRPLSRRKHWAVQEIVERAK